MASFFMKGTEKKSWKISSGFKLTFHQKWHSMVEKPKWKFDRHVFNLMMLFGACPRFFCSDVLTVTKQFMLWHCHYLSRLINSKTSSFLPLPAYFPLINICAIWIEIIAGLNVTTFMWNWPIDLCQIGTVRFWQKLLNFQWQKVTKTKHTLLCDSQDIKT